MAENIGQIYAEITARTDKFDRELDRTEKKADTSAKNMMGNFAKIAGSIVAVTAAAVALRKVFKDLSEAARTQERAVRMLAAQLQATGNAAGFTTGQLERMAAQIQKVSNVGDEDIMKEAMSSMLRFQEVTGDTFERAIALSVDMAAVTGNLSGASQQLGRSLADPIQALSLLRRQGISFTDTQRDMITGFMDVNDLASAQNVILDELESKFKGVAAAMIEPGIQLKNLFGDLKEELGFGLINATDNLAASLIPLLEDSVSMMQMLRTSTEEFAEQIKGLDKQSLEELREEYLKMLRGQLTTGQAIALWWNAMNKFFTEELIPNIGNIIVAFSPLLLGLEAASRLTSKLTGQDFPTMGEIITEIGKKYAREFLAPIMDSEKLLDNVVAITNEINNGFAKGADAVSAITEEVRGLDEAVRHTAHDFPETFDQMRDRAIDSLEAIISKQRRLAVVGLEDMGELQQGFDVFFKELAMLYEQDSVEFQYWQRMKTNIFKSFIRDNTQNTDRHVKEVSALYRGLAESMASNLGNLATDWDKLTDNMKAAFEDFAKAVIKDLIRIAIRMAVLSAFNIGTGGAASLVAAAIGPRLEGGGFYAGGIEGRNKGGIVGAGSLANKDSVITNLTRGEAVIPRDQVIRNMDIIQPMLSGGSGGGDLLKEIRMLRTEFAKKELSVNVENKIDPVMVNKANNIGQGMRGGI